MIFRNIRETFKTYDPALIICALIATLIGVVFIYSATKTMGSGARYIIVQVGAGIIGMVMMYLITKIDYEDIVEAWKTIAIVCAVLLVLVLIIGKGRATTGTQGWIRLGPVGIQPSELAKIAFIITLSKHLSVLKENVNKVSGVVELLIHLMIPVVLILLQPDYGTAMVFVFIFVAMVFAAGIYRRYIVTGFVAFGAFAVFAWRFLLDDFQKERFFAFLSPETASDTYGYHVIQSKIAVGSGQIFGKGLFNGIQTQLGILPEKHTDFIFSVIGEEAGFVLCTAVVVLMFTMIFRCLAIGGDAKTSTGSYMCVGVAAMWLFHAFENIGMTIGLMPVTGIPLPFISYGGSSLVTNFIALGIVLSVFVRRKNISF